MSAAASKPVHGLPVSLRTRWPTRGIVASAARNGTNCRPHSGSSPILSTPQSSSTNPGGAGAGALSAAHADGSLASAATHTSSNQSVLGFRPPARANTAANTIAASAQRANMSSRRDAASPTPS